MEIFNSFSGDSLRVARESRGISQTELATEVGISQGNLSKFEKNQISPSDEVLEAISNVLKFDVGLFYNKIDKIPVDIQLHRKRSTIPKKVLNKFDANIALKKFQIKKLMDSIDLNISYPRISTVNFTPEEIALKIREVLGVENGPIFNISKKIEDCGIAIVYTDQYEKIDGMAVAHDSSNPIIFLNKNQPPDRKRFSLSHEFGHIIMHGLYEANMVDVEEEANRFASEFLVPSDELEILVAGKIVNLQFLGELKKYWRVSIASLIYKLNYLKLITPERYRSLNVELSRAGYRKKEPLLGVKFDEPTLIKELIMAHIEELGYNYQSLSKYLYLDKGEFYTDFMDNNLKLA